MDDFTRLRDKRLPKALKAIQLLGNLSRRKPDPRDARQLVETLEAEVAKVRKAFKLEQPQRAPQPPQERVRVCRDEQGGEGTTAAEDLRWARDAAAYDKDLARELIERALSKI